MDSIAETLKEDYLTCVICYELFVDPKVLPCLHTFCKACLEIFIAKSPEKEEPLCPICREPFSLPSHSVSCLKSNFIFKELIAKLPVSKSARSKRLCSFCILHSKEVEATHKCVTCLDLLCSFCVRHRHIFVRQNAFHQIVHLKDYLTGKCIEKKNPEVLCENHMEKIRFFCPPCSVPICGECALDMHRYHDYVSFDKARDIIGQEMEKAMENSRSKQGEMKQEHIKLTSKLHEVSLNETFLMEEVDKKFNEIHCRLTKFRQNIEKRIRKKSCKDEEKVKASLKVNESHQGDLQESISFCENILLNRSDLEVVFFLEDMKSSLLKYSVHDERKVEISLPCLEINIDNELRKMFCVKDVGGNNAKTEEPSLKNDEKADAMTVDAVCPGKSTMEKQDTNVNSEKDAQTRTVFVAKCLKRYDLSELQNEKFPCYSSVTWIDKSSFALADDQNQCAVICKTVDGVTKCHKFSVEGIVSVVKFSNKLACKTQSGDIFIYSYPKLAFERTFQGVYTLSARSVELVWVTKQEIIIFNHDCSLTKRKILDEEGKPFKFKRPFHFCCLPNNSFALTDKADRCLYLLDGQGRISVRHTFPEHLGALSCDKENRIYMTCYEDNAISIFDTNGECSSRIALSCILTKPKAISVMDADNVLVARRNEVVLLSLK